MIYKIIKDCTLLSLINLKKTSKMFTFVQKYIDRKKELINWRISIEYQQNYNICDGIYIKIHQCWANVGNITYMDRYDEECNVCLKQNWKCGSRCYYHYDNSKIIKSSDIRTVVVTGTGGQTLQYLLNNKIAGLWVGINILNGEVLPLFLGNNLPKFTQFNYYYYDDIIVKYGQFDTEIERKDLDATRIFKNVSFNNVPLAGNMLTKYVGYTVDHYDNIVD